MRLSILPLYTQITVMEAGSFILMWNGQTYNCKERDFFHK